MTEGTAKANGDDGLGEAIGIGLLKDLTVAMLENARVTRALVLQLAGTPGDEGVPGLNENVAALGEVVEELDARITGLALKLSCVEFVLDKMGEIKDREPSWRDAVAAKAEFDKSIEDEMVKAETEEFGSVTEPEDEPEPKPKKKKMVSNGKPPHLRNLHPLPESPPKP